jgi:hypothetical protein
MNLRRLLSKCRFLDRNSNIPSCAVSSVTGRRLAAGATLIESLDCDRIRLKSPEFGRTIEESIVWRELVDLELQEIDEHIGSI